MKTDKLHSRFLFSLFAVCAFMLSSLSFASSPENNAPSIVSPGTVQDLFKGESDTLVVVNFWATWCAPCVKELPYFERLAKKDVGTPIRVVLVSMDFTEDIRKVQGFMKKKDIQSEVIVVDVSDYNTFINSISEDWSGSLPATVLYQGTTGKRQLFEREFSEDQLQKTVSSFLAE